MSIKFKYNDINTKKCTFAEYHAQFITEGYINSVVERIGADRIIASNDPFLNDIPLKEWDRIGAPVGTTEAMAEIGDYLTLSIQVSLAKQAAQTFKRQQLNK
ncbi:hypothetical protein VPHK449_0021 [Vibrio phage K449]